MDYTLEQLSLVGTASQICFRIHVLARIGPKMAKKTQALLYSSQYAVYVNKLCLVVCTCLNEEQTPRQSTPLALRNIPSVMNKIGRVHELPPLSIPLLRAVWPILMSICSLDCTSIAGTLRQTSNN